MPGSRALRLSHQSSSLPTAHLRDFCTWKQCNGTKISNTKKKKRLFCVASRNRHTQKFLDGGNTAMTRRKKNYVERGRKIDIMDVQSYFGIVPKPPTNYIYFSLFQSSIVIWDYKTAQQQSNINTVHSTVWQNRVVKVGHRVRIYRWFHINNPWLIQASDTQTSALFDLNFLRSFEGRRLTCK